MATPGVEQKNPQLILLDLLLPGMDGFELVREFQDHPKVINGYSDLLVEGFGPTEIGERLHLSVKTVSTHKTRILDKLNLGSTAELVRYALENKLV